MTLSPEQPVKAVTPQKMRVCFYCELPIETLDGDIVSPVTGSLLCRKSPTRLHEYADQPYLCLTCNQKVPPNTKHEHGCPMEGDKCGARSCNVTGKCQA